MRPSRIALGIGIVALPLLGWAAPGNADSQNRILGQAQRLLNNNGSSNADRDQRDAYERGREDERRRSEVNQDHRGYGTQEQNSNRDRESGQTTWRDRDNRADSAYRNRPTGDDRDR